MSMMNQKEAQALLEKVIKLSKGVETEAVLSGETTGNIRYANNSISTSGETESRNLVVTCAYGKKTGSATTNQFDAPSLERVVKRAQELAKLAPENPEYMGVLGPQKYKATTAYFNTTAAMDPAKRAELAAASIIPARKRKLLAAGFLVDTTGFRSMATSKGLFAYHAATDLDFSLTVRTEDGRGSGWVSRRFNDVSQFNAAAVSAVAMDKAEASRNAKAIEPGRYTVILEPAASVGLLAPMIGNFEARSADEGRSFLSKQGGSTRLGDRLFDPAVTITSNPWHPELPGMPWDGSGLPQQEVTWVDKGVVKELAYSRYWAEKQKKKPLPQGANYIMQGGTATTEELIKSTKRGILVTRTWYIRMVDPQSILLTGLTRDGTFYIEDGKIQFPLKNFRFNESPIIMLNNLAALGKPERVGQSLVPPMKIEDFTFTSLSDAV